MTFVKTNIPVSRSFDGLMNELFNGIPAVMSKSYRDDSLMFPPVNIHEKDTAYLIELSVPGFEKEDFSIQLEKNLLTINGEKKTEANPEESIKVIRKEFIQKSFKRSFTVDDKIEAGNINAKYENGLLKLILPKREEVKVPTKEITIQ